MLSRRKFENARSRDEATEAISQKLRRLEPAMTHGSMIASGSYVPWDRLSDAGNLIVVLIGLLVWVSCVFSLVCVGVSAMST